jgi:hypothetical protein
MKKTRNPVIKPYTLGKSTGTNKKVYNIIPADNDSEFKIYLEEEEYMNFLVIQFSSQTSKSKIISELRTNLLLSKKKISPSIKYCIIEENIIPIEEYIESINDEISHYYLIEKITTHDDIYGVLHFYRRQDTFDFEKFFTDVRQLFTKLVESKILFTDVKPPNTGIDPITHTLMIIDTDPEYIFIIAEENLKKYITYMLFQMYMYIRIILYKKISILHTGISYVDYKEMIEEIYSNKYGTQTNQPLHMLSYYGDNIYNSENQINKHTQYYKIKDKNTWWDSYVKEIIPIATKPKNKSEKKSENVYKTKSKNKSEKIIKNKSNMKSTMESNMKSNTTDSTMDTDMDTNPNTKYGCLVS